jgi:hypothetical protein
MVKHGYNQDEDAKGAEVAVGAEDAKRKGAEASSG